MKPSESLNPVSDATIPFIQLNAYYDLLDNVTAYDHSIKFPVCLYC